MSTASGPDPALEPLAGIAARYRDALVAGDRAQAAAAVGRGLDAGLDARSLLDHVLAPAQRELGRLWHLGRLSIAGEHLATEITREELERVRRARPPTRTHGTRAVVAAAPGEVHALAARFVATLLDCHGWEVDVLGEAPPDDGLLEHVRRRRPRLVALSVTLRDHRETTARLCRDLAVLEPRPALLVGGPGVAGLEPSALGADAIAEDAASGLRFATALLAPPPPPDLATYLAAVGRRVREARRAAGWTQAVLAERSGLARPYLGSIERGRQNITLEAALSLATALGASLTDLLAQEVP